MLELILFYIFAAIAVVSAILVITQKNVVHSAVFLAATLLSVAGIFLTLHAEFLAGVQVIVYVGGILVLFVFVIMLISVERSIHERQFNRQWMIALVTAAASDCGIRIRHLSRQRLVCPATCGCQPRLPALTGNIRAGRDGAVHDSYLLPFEIASILLLVAIVGAVVLAKKKDAGGVVMVPTYHYLILGAALFTIGVIGVLTRRNIMVILMSIELMMNAVNINLIAFSDRLQQVTGQVFAIFVITVAAAEAAVGLGIVIAMFKNKETMNINEIDSDEVVTDSNEFSRSHLAHSVVPGGRFRHQRPVRQAHAQDRRRRHCLPARF